MLIIVTQDDIDLALKFATEHPKSKMSPEYTPISFACKRMGMKLSGNSTLPQVTYQSIFADGISESLPEEATQFLKDYDAGLNVQPFSFETSVRISDSWTEKDAKEVGLRKNSKFFCNLGFGDSALKY